jgi:hypothetical protein
MIAALSSTGVDFSTGWDARTGSSRLNHARVTTNFTLSTPHRSFFERFVEGERNKTTAGYVRA